MLEVDLVLYLTAIGLCVNRNRQIMASTVPGWYFQKLFSRQITLAGTPVFLKNLTGERQTVVL